MTRWEMSFCSWDCGLGIQECRTALMESLAAALDGYKLLQGQSAQPCCIPEQPQNEVDSYTGACLWLLLNYLHGCEIINN